MNQSVKNLEKMSKNEINRLVTANFLNAVEEVVEKRYYRDVTNERELATFLNITQSSISKLKSDENRYVTLDMILRMVNLLGANSNNFFLMNEKEKEKLIREGFIVHSGHSGHTNTISNSKVGHIVQGAIVNGNNNKGNINTTLKIIDGLPAKDRKEMKEYLNTIKNQNSGLQEEVVDLKKTIARYEKAMNEKNKELKEKEKQLHDMSQKYISLLESRAVEKK